jgi:tRNA(Ile)-lysidine synthase
MPKSSGRSNVVEAVLRECRSDTTLARQPRIVVAVSGGADSSALLHALTRAAPRLGLDLTAAHLDHGLRRASRGDAKKVAALCEALGVPLVSRRDTPSDDGEDAARRLRYEFLEEVAAAAGAETIALGHTGDDQAETVLLHLVRGAGLEGLAAMRLREGLRFRPLLGLWRVDTEAHCLRHHLDPVEDATNRSPRYARNRVRRQLIPLLETFNPQVKAALVRLAAGARDEHDVVVGEASRWLAGQPARLDRRDFRALPAAVAAEAFRQAWARAMDGGPQPGTAELLEQAGRTLRSDRAEGMLNLGSGLILYVLEDRFWIAPRAAK